MDAARQGRLGWRRVTALFGIFGFLMHFRPAEPFLTPYLVDDKGLSEDEVNNQVYPVWTYSYLAFLVIVGPCAEWLGYKTVIVVQALADLATRIIVIWGTTLGQMQLMQVTYGLATAAEIGYYSLVYLLVVEDDFQRVSSWTRVLVLLGHVTSGILAQCLVSYAQTGYAVLFHVTLAFVACGTLFGLFLPWARAPQSEMTSPKESLRARSARWVADLRADYARGSVLVLSIWWSLAFCGILCVEGYASSIWYHINADVVFNGYCDSVARLCGALGAALPAFLVSMRHQDRRWRAAITCLTIGCCGTTAWMTQTDDIWSAYAAYILFEGFAYAALALCAAAVAKLLVDARFALVFGVNTFFALVVTTILQLVSGSTGFNFDIRQRFYLHVAVWVAAVLATMPVWVVLGRASDTSAAYDHVEAEEDDEPAR